MKGKIQSINLQVSKAATYSHQRLQKGLISIAKTVILCGHQNLAIRGHSDNNAKNFPQKSTSTQESNEFCKLEHSGNFNALLRFRLDAGDEGLKQHLENAPRNAVFVTSRTQNDFIRIAGSIILNSILEEVKESGPFSILADETTDISGIEQFSITLRYYYNDKLQEQFMEFIRVTSTTGENLANVIMDKLKHWGLDLNNLRGQGYDGASNMSGQFKGVKSNILSEYPLALYTHCSAHCLNLAIVHACKLPLVRNMFGTVKEVGTFLRESAKRQHVFQTHILKLCPKSKYSRIKSLCETRWTERADVLEMFLELIDPIFSTLEDLQDSDNNTSSKAKTLHLAISQFDFLLAVKVVHNIISLTVPVSKALQSQTVDLVSASEEINGILRLLQGYRASIESFYQPLYDRTVVIATQYEVEPKIPRRTSLQIHRENIPGDNPTVYFQRALVIPFVDHVLTQLQDRFTELNQKAFLAISLVPKYACKKSTTELQIALNPLSEMYYSDLPQPNSLESEVARWYDKWKNYTGDLPCTILQALQSCYKDFYPNLWTLLRILAVLPVSVAECERSFSTLRRTKTYLRSTIGQERLNGIALLNIHVTRHVTAEQMVDIFMKEGCHRIN